MKRILCLLCCLLLVFGAGCQKEPEPTPSPVVEKYKGALHTLDGLTQNTAVRMEITDLDTENSTFNFILYNDTDYELGYNDFVTHVIGVWVWQDDAWFKITDIQTESAFSWSDLHKLAPKSHKEGRSGFYSPPDYSFPQSGVYRVVLFAAGLNGLEDGDPFSDFDICAYYSTDTATPTLPQE